jgi:DNA-binding transcriptional LysR family regulator
MDLGQLRAFVAIADTGGVSRAAEKLNMSQPALSRQLKSLEADLGVALFDREQRKLRLTSAGEDLLSRARALIVDAGVLRERAQALQSGTTGVLRLGATPPMIEALLAPFLAHWRIRHPGIALHVSEDGGSSLANRLDRGEVHLAYVPADDARFDYKLLFPIHVVAVVKRGHALARTRCIEITRLDGVPLLALRRGFGSRDWFDKACEIAHFYPKLVFESASHNVILTLAAADYGVGVLPSAVVPSPERVHLLPLTHEGVPIGKWTMLAWSRRRSLPSFATTFIDEFGAFAREHYPGRALLSRTPKIAMPRGLRST